MKKISGKLFKYIKPFIFISVLSALLSAFVSLGNAAPSWLVKYIIDDVLVMKDRKVLGLVCIAIVLVTFIKGIASYYRQYIQAYISGNMTKNIRLDLYKKLIYLSQDYFGHAKSGDIVTRFVSDITKMQDIIRSSFNLFIEVGTILILMYRLIYLNYKLALVCIIVLPLSGNMVKKFLKRLKKTGKGIQETYSNLNNIVQESVSGINVIKSFANESFEINKFEQVNNGFYKIWLKNRKINSRVKPIVEFFNTISVALVTYYGGTLVVKGDLTPGDLMAFLTALGLMYAPIKTIMGIISGIQTNLPAVDRVFDILECDNKIVEKENAKELKNVIGDVVFNKVSFSYSGSEGKVLNDISLEAKQGDIIAFVGKSGSGKSTLVRLLTRFYDIDSGEISIDGIDIRDLKLKGLRKNIGFVPQENFLFSGTVFENIAYGKEGATKEEIIEASKMANAYEFINSMPNGYDTKIGERGVKLSGGQRQRLAIARALLKNPKILILDEATSALDTESEKLVQEALDRLMKARTSFVVAHRLSTILHADKIVVMDEGEIKEIGTKDELLKINGIFKKLYDTQFKGVE